MYGWRWGRRDNMKEGRKKQGGRRMKESMRKEQGQRKASVMKVAQRGRRMY